MAGEFPYLYVIHKIMGLKSFASGSTFCSTPTQSVFTYSNPAMETQEYCVKYVQS